MFKSHFTIRLAAAIALSAGALLGSAAHAATATAIFAGGCFWCIEKDFEALPGVVAVESGYTAGKTPKPTGKRYCNNGVALAFVPQGAVLPVVRT